jgi:hypothetical protein
VDRRAKTIKSVLLTVTSLLDSKPLLNGPRHHCNQSRFRHVPSNTFSRNVRILHAAPGAIVAFGNCITEVIAPSAIPSSGTWQITAHLVLRSNMTSEARLHSLHSRADYIFIRCSD